MYSTIVSVRNILDSRCTKGSIGITVLTLSNLSPYLGNLSADHQEFWHGDAMPYASPYNIIGLASVCALNLRIEF